MGEELIFSSFILPMVTKHLNEVLSQHIQASQHVNTHIHTIIQYIKQFDYDVSFEDIYKNTDIDLGNQSNQLILKALETNIRISKHGDTLRFCPEFNIRSSSDLMEVMSKHLAVEQDRLTETPIDILDFIAEMVNTNRLYMVKDVESGTIIYFNDMPDKKCVNDDLKRLFFSVKLPCYNELLTELRTSGLKTDGSHTKMPIKAPSKSKGRKRLKKL